MFDYHIHKERIIEIQKPPFPFIYIITIKVLVRPLWKKFEKKP